MGKGKRAKRLLFTAFLAGVFFMFLGLGGALSTWVFIKSKIEGEVVTVPDLFGFSEEEARQVIAALDLEMIVDRDRIVHTDLVEKGNVFLQVPRQGRKIKTGRTIEITLSSGPTTKPIPGLQGETLSFARTLLKEVDADAQVISRIPSAGRTKGRILSQWPLEGEEIGLRQGASLLVADGEPMPFFVMPDLIGKDYLSVRTFLDKAGLRHVTKYKAEDEDLGQIILAQTPKAGYAVSRAKTITLTVNKDF